MEHKLTEDQTCSKQQKGLKTGNADSAIYLRTYDVINALDRAQNQHWWQNLFRSDQSIPSIPLQSKEPLFAIPNPAQDGPPREAEPSATIDIEERMSSEAELQTGAPVLARLSVRPPSPLELALVRSDYRLGNNDSGAAINSVRSSRRFSWVLLALLAVGTAGITFAIVHLASASLAVDPAGQRPKHVNTYITKQAHSLRHFARS
jgi:hypothetical protein